MRILILSSIVFLVGCHTSRTIQNQDAVHTDTYGIKDSCFNYVEKKDTLGGYLLFHLCGSPCGTMGGGVSLSLIKINNRDTVRVLDLCNVCGNGRRFKKGDRLSVIPYGKGDVRDFMPSVLLKNGKKPAFEIDPESCRFETFYGTLINRTEEAITEQVKMEYEAKAKPYEQPATPKQIKAYLQGSWRYEFSIRKNKDTCFYREDYNIVFTRSRFLWRDGRRLIKGKWKIDGDSILMFQRKSNQDSTGQVHNGFVRTVEDGRINFEVNKNFLILHFKENEYWRCNHYHFRKRDLEAEAELKKRLLEL
jgi:hypothetical protein